MPVALAVGQYAYRGFVFGAGTEYLLKGPIDGLGEFETRIGDRELPRGHGDVPGKHYNAPLQMIAGFTLGRDVPSDLEDALVELGDVFRSSEDDSDELEWLEHGQAQRLVRCRPIGFKRGYKGTSGRVAYPKVALLAADPRIYSAVEHQQTVPLYTPGGGGLEFPLEFPLTFSPGTVVDVVAANAGESPAYPTVRFFGPASGTCTGVTLSNRTTGVDLDITASVGSGQILTADMGAFVTGSGGLVIGLDGSSRYGDWTQPRVPLALQPGDNVLSFQITGTATSMACIANFRDTWLG